jgi:hypothetical protein
MINNDKKRLKHRFKLRERNRSTSTYYRMLQIREYKYYGYTYFVIFVGTFMMSLNAINLVCQFSF